MSAFCSECAGLRGCLSQPRARIATFAFDGLLGGFSWAGTVDGDVIMFKFSKAPDEGVQPPADITTQWLSRGVSCEGGFVAGP